MKRWALNLFATFALLLLLPLTASAQSFNATLTGNVTDPSGAPVPDVEVTLTSKATGAVCQVKNRLRWTLFVSQSAVRRIRTEGNRQVVLRSMFKEASPFFRIRRPEWM